MAKKDLEEVKDSINEDIRDPRVYEVGYLLVPQIKEEDLDAEIDVVRNLITAQGGLPISEGRADLIDLAYPMTKAVNNETQQFTKGYFGWIKFDVSPEKLQSIKEDLDKVNNVIRFLLISTVKEDTMAATKKAIAKFPKGESDKQDKKPVVRKKEETPKEPIDEEKLDKQIDELVVGE